MSEYLEFVLVSEIPKTGIYEVRNKLGGDPLGVIKWFGRWHGYCFFPEGDTVFSQGCMQEIINFIESLKK